MNATDKIINDFATEARERQEEERRLNEQIHRISANDLIDTRLRAISYKHNPPIKILKGMVGGFKIIEKATKENWYKAKAADHLLRLRRVRRWNFAHIGIELSPQSCARILADAALCRRRAMGKDMPKIVLLGVPR